MIIAEGGKDYYRDELPEFQIGRVMLTATELAGLAACEEANRTSAWECENNQKGEDPPSYVGKKPTRYRFVLRHNSKPDPETGIITLTKEPHRHIRRCGVSEARRAALKIACVPVWRLRAPEISDWDTSE